MRVNFYYIFILPIVFLPVLFNSCAEKLNLDKEILYSKSSCPKPEGLEFLNSKMGKLNHAVQSPFQYSKLQIEPANPSNNHGQQKVTQNILPEGYELSVIFNSQCLKNNSSVFADHFNLSLDLLLKQYNNSFALNFKLPKSMTASELSSFIHQDICVVGASSNKKYETQSISFTDPYFDEQKPHFNSIQHLDALSFINNSLPEALQQDVKIAVLDTGVDYNHPDLKANMIQLQSGQKGYLVSNGEVVAGSPMDRSQNSHGTHVTGIIAALNNNSEGGTGLAYFSKVLAVNVFDNYEQGYYSTSANVYNGIQKAIQEKVDIINLSIGQFSDKYQEDASYMQGLIDAVANNILVVTVIGNDTGQYNTTEVDGVNLSVIPGMYGAAIDGVITVASVDANTNTLSNFSLYSQVFAEIAAPGSVGPGSTQGIYSTKKYLDSSIPYGAMKGTSMAAPVVSSVAALAVAILKQKSVAYSAKDLENLLKNSAHRSYKLNCMVRDNQIVNSLNMVKSLVEL